MNSVLEIIVVLVFIVLSAFFSGSETAIVSCSRIRLRYRAAEGSWRARRLEGLIGHPERFFSIVLVGTNLSVIICTAAATAFAVSRLGSPGAAVATIVMTPLLLVFGEVIPKSAFLYHADRVSVNVAPVLLFFSYALWPLVAPATLLSRFLMRLAGSHDKRFNILSTREELVYLYRRGKKDGALERRERFIMNRVFNFQSIRARELIVPMKNVVSLPVTVSVGEAVEKVKGHTYSRFPVIARSGSRVVGIASLFDLLGLDGGERLATVMHPPFIANAEDSAEKLLLAMKDQALHMAVIVNEKGEHIGIVTLEDILENIVGDIANEYD